MHGSGGFFDQRSIRVDCLRLKLKKKKHLNGEVLVRRQNKIYNLSPYLNTFKFA